MTKRIVPRRFKAHSTDDANRQDLMTIEECRQYLKKYHMSDVEIEMIRNAVTGIVNGVITSYLSRYM